MSIQFDKDEGGIEGNPLELLFSLKKPKDAKAGLASGAKSLVRGVAAGAAGLIAAPVIGGMTEGVTGVGKGLATGSFMPDLCRVIGSEFYAWQAVRLEAQGNFAIAFVAGWQSGLAVFGVLVHPLITN